MFQQLKICRIPNLLLQPKRIDVAIARADVEHAIHHSKSRLVTSSFQNELVHRRHDISDVLVCAGS